MAVKNSLVCTLSQVTLLQLKKEFGKGKSARAFIAELIKGFLPYIL